MHFESKTIYAYSVSHPNAVALKMAAYCTQLCVIKMLITFAQNNCRDKDTFSSHVHLLNLRIITPGKARCGWSSPVKMFYESFLNPTTNRLLISSGMCSNCAVDDLSDIFRV